MSGNPTYRPLGINWRPIRHNPGRQGKAERKFQHIKGLREIELLYRKLNPTLSQDEEVKRAGRLIIGTGVA